MDKSLSGLTVSQFAKLHEVNKRTLHYYDSIGLFSPLKKGANNYRYYTPLQSLDFEYIKMLKELNMSIDEISIYLKNPNPVDFFKIIDSKATEIEEQMKRLEQIKRVLNMKKEQLEICESLEIDDIKLVELPETRYLMAPFKFQKDKLDFVFSNIKDIWGIEQCRMGIGSYISVDKIKNRDSNIYDGLFSPLTKEDCNLDSLIRVKGTYLCTYQKGSWKNSPNIYEKILSYIDKNNFKIVGNVYEIAMNNFAVSKKEDLITEIIIKVENRH